MISSEWTPVVSSNIEAIKYDETKSELYVRFNSGATYVYEAVPPDEAENLAYASSPGSYLRSDIMGTYNARRI